MDTKLIQLTDCHLLADPDAAFKGVNPRRTLEQVCAHLARHHAGAAALLLTGDLSQDETAESYRLLRRVVEAHLAMPAYALPGNHDDPEQMPALTGGRIRLDRTAELGGWQILMAHSNIPGRAEGELDERQIQWLDECLSATRQPGLLALHHPPLAVGSAWMDRIGLRNGERLADLVRRHPSLKCIIHGHAHQACCVYTDGRPCYGTPSTWRQFVPAAADHRMDCLPPALRVIRLAPDGGHSSWVEFVQTPP